MLEVTLDGKKLVVEGRETIYALCVRMGIRIPALCHDERVTPHGSCGMCVVEVQGYGLVTSCTTPVADGMVIETRNAKVIEARKERLHDLIRDHYGDCTAPCERVCPAGIDVQGYLSLIARGAYREAVELIKERLPLPAVIGRICPHFCEQACRRNLVDEPVAICSLKRFVADDELLGGKKSVPSVKPKTGKRVAIVGAGPAGLTAAYYLAREGHAVKLFEALPKPGGMLRYGIPDYRLPQELLDAEIDTITALGVEIQVDQRLGRDFTLQGLQNGGFDAVFVAIGCHQSMKLGIEGEDLRGVYAGTEFLRDVAAGERPYLGKRVAVVGGGNSAIDAVRTAVRLGTEEVTLVYRRSLAEMPASPWEIEEAEEEGVHLQYLAAPVRVLGQDGKVVGLEYVKMALGEPDTSGRRRPEPIPGTEAVLEVDTVIAAIGQRPEPTPLADETAIRTTRGGTIIADPVSMVTDMEGVFAGGDCVSGAATAVEAIAAGRKAAISIMRYLAGEDLPKAVPIFDLSKGELKELEGAEEYAALEKRDREPMPKIPLGARGKDFTEIEKGFGAEAAVREASRCLECGCKADYYCELRELAMEYGVANPPRRERELYPLDRSHPFIERDPNKCIACALCDRVCATVQGVGALGFSYRVATHEGNGGSLLNTTCESCGQCVASCPVGALVAKKEMLPAKEVKTVCTYCGVGCGIYLGVRGDSIVSLRGDRESPANRNGNLCVKGRFGYEFVNSPERLTRPLIKRNGRFEEASWDEALDLVAARLPQYQGDRFALVASAKCTNEENYLFQKFARGVMGTNSIDHCART